MDALGHTEIIDKAVAPTCTETGLTEGKHCYVCNAVLVKQEAVEALGHNAEAIPGKAPTCTETGLIEDSKCSVCGEVLVQQEGLQPVADHDENLMQNCKLVVFCRTVKYQRCSLCGRWLDVKGTACDGQPAGITAIQWNGEGTIVIAAYKDSGQMLSVQMPGSNEASIPDAPSVKIYVLSDGFVPATEEPLWIRA